MNQPIIRVAAAAFRTKLKDMNSHIKEVTGGANASWANALPVFTREDISEDIVRSVLSSAGVFEMEKELTNLREQLSRFQWRKLDSEAEACGNILAWMSSQKGFEDIVVQLVFHEGAWWWEEDMSIVKRPDLINGWMPYPAPPTETKMYLTHKTKGGRYRYIGTAKVKDPEGKWQLVQGYENQETEERFYRYWDDFNDTMMEIENG